MQTSYDYINAQIKQAGLIPKDIASYCGTGGLFNCILPAEVEIFPQGLYSAGSTNIEGDLIIDPSQAPVTFDTTRSSAGVVGTSVTWSHTIGSGSNRLLVVSISLNSFSGQTLATLT